MKYRLFFAGALFLSAGLFLNAEGREDAPRIVNVINFLRQNDYRIENDVQLLYDAAREEVELSRKFGFPSTFLLQYDALVDPAYQDLMKSLPGNCEVGGWWEITKPHYEDAGYKWPFEQVWYPHDVLDFGIGHSPETRERLVDVYMEKFREVFGHYPESMGSWFIDAHTLAYMEEKYHIVASCVCKEQVGTDGYTLWGSYWNQAFYPSRLNAHIPAQTAEGQIKVPVFRMLGSDPVYQYDDALGSNGQGVCTMEPVYGPAGGNEEWVKSFFDTFTSQPCLEFNYVQIGQENSFTWPRIGKALEMQFRIVDSLKRGGKVMLMTLGESGEWFRERYEVTPATAFTVMEDTRGLGKKVVWYDSRFYRTSLIWEPEGFRIRDIHKFDENKRSAYLDSAATGTKLVYKTLPVVDGFLWSEGGQKAGLLIKYSDGSHAVLGTPSIREEENSLLIESADMAGNIFKFVLGEREISIEGPQTGWTIDLFSPVPGWPFINVTPERLDAEFDGFFYSVVSDSGKFACGNSLYPISIFPDGGKVKLKF